MATQKNFRGSFQITDKIHTQYGKSSKSVISTIKRLYNLPFNTVVYMDELYNGFHTTGCKSETIILNPLN